MFAATYTYIYIYIGPKLFGYHKWESVSAVLLGLGKHNVKHLNRPMLHKVNFYRHLLYDCDALLCSVFLTFLALNFSKNSIVKSVFQSRLIAVNDVRLSYLLTCTVVYSFVRLSKIFIYADDAKYTM